MRLNALALLAAAITIKPVSSGPLAYAACQTGMLQVH